ncbi:MAG TPA: hypothetical protein VFN64_00570 [Burkholderiaceae bacterium]|nr:hypothetical protein [Burkholderiaceae bacterium]
MAVLQEYDAAQSRLAILRRLLAGDPPRRWWRRWWDRWRRWQ